MAKRLRIVKLAPDEKEKLLSWISDPETNDRLKRRARIILYTYERIPVKRIQEELVISRESISTWKKRFLESRLDGLLDLRIRKKKILGRKA